MVFFKNLCVLRDEGQQLTQVQNVELLIFYNFVPLDAHILTGYSSCYV